MQILVHLHVNKTNFHMKDSAPGLALKQRQLGNRLLQRIYLLKHIRVLTSKVALLETFRFSKHGNAVTASTWTVLS